MWIRLKPFLPIRNDKNCRKEKIISEISILFLIIMFYILTIGLIDNIDNRGNLDPDPGMKPYPKHRNWIRSKHSDPGPQPCCELSRNIHFNVSPEIVKTFFDFRNVAFSFK